MGHVEEALRLASANFLPPDGTDPTQDTVAERLATLINWHSELSIQAPEREIVGELHPALAALVNLTVQGGIFVTESIRLTKYGDWEVELMTLNGDIEAVLTDVATALGERITAICRETFYPRRSQVASK